MEMYRRTYAEINLDHLEHNILALQKAFPQAPLFCPMIKANGYGHGDAPLGRFLETVGVKHLGVCLIEEGLVLRKMGIKAEILVFRGFDREGAEKILQYNMTPVVSTWDHLEHLESLNVNDISIHLKFDTGMNRLGFRPEEAQKLFDRLWQNKKIRLKAVCTHLFQGEDAQEENGKSAEQLRKLDKITQLFKHFNIFSHALNSAGILNHISCRKNSSASKADHPLFIQNWGLRPGLMIYGYNPLSDQSILDLKPIMSLKSHANSFRFLQTGETVSYAGTWRAQRESVIAVIPIGYADGYRRVLSNKASALFAGQRVPVIGSVCMDYLMLDVTDVVKDRNLNQFKNQEVTLFGYDSLGNFLSPDELAHQAYSITWEMLTSIGERVPRIYTGGAGEGNDDIRSSA